MLADIGFVGYLRLCLGHWCTLLGPADSFVLSFLPLQIINNLICTHTILRAQCTAHMQYYLHTHNLTCTYTILCAHMHSYLHTHNLMCTYTSLCAHTQWRGVGDRRGSDTRPVVVWEQIPMSVLASIRITYAPLIITVVVCHGRHSASLHCRETKCEQLQNLRNTLQCGATRLHCVSSNILVTIFQL